jgi:hypothetical protein
MPLFSRAPAPGGAGGAPANVVTHPPPVVEEPRRHNTLFSRRRSTSPSLDSSTSLSHDRHNHTKNHSGGLLHRNTEDPSISSARERVLAAENAEREADRALKAAKVAVRDAREHAKRLEKEAAEDARLARVKVGQAKSISKGVGRLGRHDHV